MSAATLPNVRLLTAEEFAALPDNGMALELVEGVPVPMNMPSPRHGEICVQTAFLLKLFLTNNPLGRVTGNDSGVITRRGPDTVRGADVAFYSFARVPADVPLPMQGYTDVPPDLVFEIRSFTERWTRVHTKVAEYLTVGVDTVVVLDEQTQRAWMYRADADPVEFNHDAELTFPPPLDGWRVNVRRFFE